MQVPDEHSEDPTKEPPEEEVNPPKFIQNYVFPGCPVTQEPEEEKERREEENEKEGEVFVKVLGSKYIFHRSKPHRIQQRQILKSQMNDL